jgi:phosphate transport system substrate-binding protein
MLQKRSASVANFVLLTTLSAVAVPWLAARAYPVFPQSGSVSGGTNVRIAGSSSLNPLNQSLKQAFERQYPGTKVTVTNAGTTAALTDVAAGKADLAAIGRPLSNAEKAKGLVAVPVGRDKIAIVVGTKNPFKKDLTVNQFAKLFRGEAKTWKAVGGPNNAVRFVDRVSSDTRVAFPSYQVFQGKKLASGTTAVKLQDDSMVAMKGKLGANGVSFLAASLAASQKDLRMLTINGVKPTDQKYPFSQPLFYVYKGNQPNASVQAFLGLAGSQSGQSAIAKSGVKQPIDFNQQATAAQATAAKVAQIPATVKSVPTKAGEPTPADAKKAVSPMAPASAPASTPATAKTQTDEQQKVQTAVIKPGDQAPAANAPSAGQSPAPETTQVQPPAAATGAAGDQIAGKEAAGRGIPPWLWWLLLPLGLLGLLLWLLPKDEEEDVQLRGDKDQLDDTAVDDAPTVEWEPRSTTVPELPLTSPDYNLDLPDVSEFVTDDLSMPSVPGQGATAPEHPKEQLSQGAELGGAAIAGAAAAGLGATAWSRLRSGDDEPSATANTGNIAEAEWEFEGELPAVNPDTTSRMADFVPDTNQPRDTSLVDRPQGSDSGAIEQRQDFGSNLASGSKDAVESTFNQLQTDIQDGTQSVMGAATGAAGAVTGSFAAGKEQVQSVSADALNTTTDAIAGTSGWLKSWFGKAKNVADDATQAVADVGDQLKDRVVGTANLTTAAIATGDAAAVNPVISDSGRVAMVPYNSREALVRWEMDTVAQDNFRTQGGTQLVLRLYDVTDMDSTTVGLPTFEQFDVDEMAQEQRILIPQRDRTYMTVLGYLTRSGGFLEVSRSDSVQIPAA